MGKKDSFIVGDYVFAKVKGYPAWPAKVRFLCIFHNNKTKMVSLWIFFLSWNEFRILICLEFVGIQLARLCIDNSKQYSLMEARNAFIPCIRASMLLSIQFDFYHERLDFGYEFGINILVMIFRSWILRSRRSSAYTSMAPEKRKCPICLCLICALLVLVGSVLVVTCLLHHINGPYEMLAVLWYKRLVLHGKSEKTTCIWWNTRFMECSRVFILLCKMYRNNVFHDTIHTMRVIYFEAVSFYSTLSMKIEMFKFSCNMQLTLE